MKMERRFTKSIPCQAAILVLASAIVIPAWAQQSQPQNSSSTAPAAAQSSDNQQGPPPAATTYVPPAKEGFWGRVNPFARKKWVKKQTDPINDRLTELDQVNARNAQEIKDVDARAQAGIHKAQSSADAANQAATAAGNEAQNANNAAQQASNHVDQINNTVQGLDQYHQITEMDVTFRPGTMNLTDQSRQDLDKLASSLTGRDGYLLEMDAHAPGNGSLGIQSSERLAEAVKRYLVVDHQIPIYRMRSVALGNVATDSGNGNAATASGNEEQTKPEHVRTRTVHIRLMENSLAAQAPASPQGASASTGTVQP